MRHKNRSRMNQNDIRRNAKADRCKPLKKEEQERRAKANKEAKTYRYPSPPTYDQPNFGEKGSI